ncbi:transmembrane protein 94-like protein l(2)k05819 [Brevipalpus obovatus]|uniref:transmembrane protein 94-like protein l(2)k05819 n=1 Tax=Brevipalpus obovatus TaxID=246614 RepID=UPI003D9F3946
MNYYSNEGIGLSSGDALNLLHQELDKELKSCKKSSQSGREILLWLRESFCHSSESSTFRWPSIVLTSLIIALFTLVCVFTADTILVFQTFLLTIFLVFNISLTLWDTRLRHRELHRKCRLLADKIKSCAERSQLVNEWRTGNYYPNLYLPESPCITLQWAYRDNHRINLPTSLLVKGDVILLCPDRAAPGLCRSLEPLLTTKSGEQRNLELKPGEFFSAVPEHDPISFIGARLRKAAKPTKFVMLETPYISRLRLAVERSWRRPATLYEKERHIILAKYIERIIVPLVIFIVMIVSIVHYAYLVSLSPSGQLSKGSISLLILRPANCLIPLISLTLSTLWLTVNACGVTYLHSSIKRRPCPNKLTSLNSKYPTGESPDSFLQHGGDDMKLKGPPSNSFFDDLETESAMGVGEPVDVTWHELLRGFFNLLFSRDESLWRSSNLLQVLGSITALCCVDKKGILSWPNPTADKIFFLSPNTNKGNASIEPNQAFLENDEDEISVDKVNYQNVKNAELTKETGKIKKEKYCSKPEVLDITHDTHSSFGLQFDDPGWRRFLPNLKPLGLSILLNTCNLEAEEEYTAFCDHITCESLRNQASVPVVNKRCLCELSRLMNFTEKAIKDYRYLFQVSSFRHVKPEVIQQHKLARSLNIHRLKMPFPHTTSAVIRDVCTGSHQLFSQGTGDLILDACTEFWDGHDLCTLSDQDRKRIMDFYHRSSLAAYCMAFSYVPLDTCPDRRLVNDYYIELPPDCWHLFRSLKSLDSSIEPKDSHSRPLLSHHLSTDSLTLKNEHEEDSHSSSTQSKSTSSTASIDGYTFETLLRQLTNQVFIGMVTMQYQACPDFVALVEQLEKACVRFVHFSKENELRSRVFSEKMGLESGWNCHISLLSDAAAATKNQSQQQINALKGSKVSVTQQPEPSASCLVRTQSAPSYINADPNAANSHLTCLPNSKMDKNDENNPDSMSVDQGIRDVDKESETSSLSSHLAKENINLIEEVPGEGGGSKSWSNASTSPSHATETTNTDQSAPIAFDMTNRAKLPKGIENIRPHLEEVDNVPLLVSLFTDCTPETTREMIKIMQENGEVVCAIGSAANISNMPIFLQADASIGIEPLYPQVCVREPIIKAKGKPFKGFLSPTDISNQLNSLPCCLAFHREDSISLIRIIMEARHFMMNARNCLQFFFSCSLGLTLGQLFASLIFLPPLLSSGSVLWLVIVIFPLLSLSLMGTPLDIQVMNLATGKNLNLSRESIIYFLFCYLIKFSPSMMIVTACFALIINNSCSIISDDTLSQSCWIFLNANATILDNDVWMDHLLIAQTFSAFFLIIYIMIISIGFVHRSHILWQRSPFQNRCWGVSIFTIIVFHTIYCAFQILFLHHGPFSMQHLQMVVPNYVIGIALFWPLLLISINSLIKRHEIKVSERQQRRARLEFGTKLGMNSPF